MKEYTTLPLAWRDDPGTTAVWVDRALVHTSSLPPEKKKKKS
jgi:hypothetical protein